MNVSHGSTADYYKLPTGSDCPVALLNKREWPHKDVRDVFDQLYSYAGTRFANLPTHWGDLTELYQVCNYVNMNGNVAEAFRALYRLGQDHHSPIERDLDKAVRYIEFEVERLQTLEEYQPMLTAQDYRPLRGMIAQLQEAKYDLCG